MSEKVVQYRDLKHIRKEKEARLNLLDVVSTYIHDTSDLKEMIEEYAREKIDKGTIILNNTEYEKFSREVEELIALDPAEGTEDASRLNFLMEHIEKYEEEHFPIEEPTAEEKEQFRKEQTDGV